MSIIVEPGSPALKEPVASRAARYQVQRYAARHVV